MNSPEKTSGNPTENTVTHPAPHSEPGLAHAVRRAWRRSRRVVLVTAATVGACVGLFLLIGTLARQRAELVRAEGCGNAAECGEVFYAFGTGPVQTLLILGTGLELFLPVLPVLAGTAGLLLGLFLAAPADDPPAVTEHRRVPGELVVAASVLTGAFVLLGLAALWAYLPYASFDNALGMTSDEVELLPALPLITVTGLLVGAGGPLLLRRLRSR